MALFPCGNAGITGTKNYYILAKFQNPYINLIVTFFFLFYKADSNQNPYLIMPSG